MTRSQQLADAFYAMAYANHYMVGIVEAYTVEELLDAEQILIDREVINLPNDTLDLALDLIEDAKRGLRVS